VSGISEAFRTEHGHGRSLYCSRSFSDICIMEITDSVPQYQPGHFDMSILLFPVTAKP
jgi:hypothetical protein